MRIATLVLLFCIGCHATNPVPAPHLTPPKPISRQSPPAPSAAAQISESPSGGLLSSFTQKIAKWFWPVGKDQTTAPPPEDARASPSDSVVAATSWEGSARGRKSKCSPCNSVPWVPIARALGYQPQAPQGHGRPSSGYSLQVPTLSLSAVPVGSHHGPPKPEYGPPQQQPLKPEYGPPKPEYGPPQPEQRPRPEYGPPPQQLPPPQPNYGPPRIQPDYGPPPKPEYGPPSQHYGPPQKSETGPPVSEYGPPSSGYGASALEAPKPDYGAPPKPDYGTPPHSDYGPPPNPDYGPPNRDYGPPPKPENGPPLKPNYGPPQTDYGSPPPPPPPSAPSNQDYSAPSQEYSAPGQSFSSPNSDLSPPGHSISTPQLQEKPPVQYGPPQPNEPPKPQYGVPSQEPPPPPPIQHVPPKPIYGPPKPLYLPPQKNTYLPPPPKRVPFPRPAPNRPVPVKPVYGPPRPTYGTPPDPIPQSGPSALASLSYQQYLSPPPLKSGDAYHSLNLNAIPFPELSPAPLPPIHNPTNFGTPTGPSEPPPSHSNIVLTINEPETSCSKCPPTGPDLSQRHRDITEDAKHAVANFGNLPLSDSAHEGSNIEITQVHRPNLTSNDVEVMKSIPLNEYLSSVEYPMQIVQAPILDVPELPKYFDLSYQSFHQHLLKNQIPSRPYESEAKAQTAQRFENPPVVHVTSPAPQTFSSPTTHQPRQYFNTRTANDTLHDSVPLSTQWGNTFPSTLSISARPFVSSTTPRNAKTNNVHQIIIPYTTARKPVQARKVPPTSSPDLEAIYVNRGVSSPDASISSTAVDHALVASNSDKVEIVDQVNALSSETVDKLVQISQSDDSKSGLKHILASDIRALLEGERDTVDLSRLQKNIDQWTVEGFGRRENLPQLTSKKIPDYFFTTQTPMKSDHEAAASHHYPIYFKGNPSSSTRQTDEKDDLNETAFTHELYGWSLLNSNVQNETPSSTRGSIATQVTSTTTQKPWEELEVSISPLTKERVYVVTPQTIQQDEGSAKATTNSSNKLEQSSRVTRQLTAPDSHPSGTENVEVVTPTNKRDDKELEPDNDMIPEIPATVTYIGSASSLRHSPVQFSQASTS